MLPTDYLGFIAGLLVTISLVPQLVRVFRLQSAHEISLVFTGLLLIGMMLWLVYGIELRLAPVMLWNAAGIILSGLLLYAKMRYGR